MAHEPQIIGRWIDPLGNKVVLTFARWTEHVLRRHPHMLFLIEDVGKTIEEPECISKDRDERLYFREVIKRGDRFCLKVVVREHYRGEQALVVTAHRVRKIKLRGVLEWQRT